MKLTISLFNFIVDCDNFLNYVFLLSYVVGQRMKNKEFMKVIEVFIILVA